VDDRFTMPFALEKLRDRIRRQHAAFDRKMRRRGVEQIVALAQPGKGRRLDPPGVHDACQRSQRLFKAFKDPRGILDGRDEVQIDVLELVRE